jgi:hypothetical protein
MVLLLRGFQITAEPKEQTTLGRQVDSRISKPQLNVYHLFSSCDEAFGALQCR